MKITFFSPNLAIVPHFSAEMRLARILTRRNTHKVEFLACGAFFEKDCTISRYLGLSIPNTSKVDSNACAECSKVVKLAKRKDRFRFRELNEFLTTSDKKIFTEIRNQITQDPINFSYNGISFGRIAAYELILEFKKSNLVFEGAQLETLTNYVENSLRTYLAAADYLSKHQPERIIIFNAQYCVGASFALAAAERDIRVDVLSFSSVIAEMHQYIRLWDWGVFKSVNPALTFWQSKNLTPSRIEKYRLARNFRVVRKATSPWTYSTPASGIDIRKYFNISPEKKIVLAVMNSLDEQFAAVTSKIWPETFSSGKVFKDQEEWIRNLALYLDPIENVVLIVRPHPREFPNKREQVLAEITKSRGKFLAELPHEVIVDSPKLGIPIEDYFSEITAVTTGWSSIGLEWQMRGRVCVTYDSNLPMYPSDTHLTGVTRDEYFTNIQNVISGTVDDPDRLTQNALSWYLFSNFKGTARLGSSVLSEAYLSDIVRKTKLLGVITRYFPKFKIWLDLHSIGFFPNRKKILQYFSSNQSSFLSNS